MSSKSPRLLGFILIGFVQALSLGAQPAVRPIKTVKFRLLSWSTTLADFNYESKHSTTQVDLIVPNTRTKVFSYTGADDLLFYNTAKPKEGKDERVPVLRVPYAELSDHILILVNDTTLPYTARVLVENAEKFPPGSFRFINFTPLMMKVAVGAEISDLASRGESIFKPATLKSGDVITLRIAAEVEKNAAKLIYSNRWMFGDKERVMLFLSRGNAEQNGGLMVKFFTEDFNLNPAVEPAD